MSQFPFIASSKCIFTDFHPVISRQHQTTPVNSGSNPPRREAEPENDTLGRKFHFQMIVKTGAANMVLQAMAKLFTEQLQRMFHTSWYPPIQAKTPPSEDKASAQLPHFS